MKPQDIKVGQKYTHAECLGYIWLGCGKRIQGTPGTEQEHYNDKCLVVVINVHQPEKIGGISQSPEDCHEGWWDGYRPLGEDQTYVVLTR
jgi:hypothetical protein